MRMWWSRPVPRLRNTLVPVTEDSMVHCETRGNRIVLTKSSGQITRPWLLACSQRGLALCFLPSMLVLTQALKLGFTSSQCLKYETSNTLIHDNA